ncbi:MAG: hypothetical protein H6581_26990 [Bacteroidia bacterium]|nr:hypothetical protein [Bacteroidia bacterium]
MKTTDSSIILSPALLKATFASGLTTVLMAPLLVLLVLFFTDRHKFDFLYEFGPVLIGWGLAAGLAVGLLFLVFIPITILFQKQLAGKPLGIILIPFLLAALGTGLLAQGATFGFRFADSFIMALTFANLVCLVTGSLIFTCLMSAGLPKPENGQDFYQTGEDIFVEQF